VSERPLRLRVEASARPDPFLLRSAIAARLAGRVFPSRAEDEVAERVAEAVRGRLTGGRSPWR
jgi:hypothetical protein